MKKIKLTQGQVALVDDADFDWLNQWKWYATYDPKMNSFYAVQKSITVDGKWGHIIMHRQILGLERGDKKCVDHTDHNTLNNSRSNIRICTHQQNHMNRKPNTNTSSKYKGVCWYKRYKKWVAKIKIKGKTKYIGYFTMEEAAARAYDGTAKKEFGEFAYLNFGG